MDFFSILICASLAVGEAAAQEVKTVSETAQGTGTDVTAQPVVLRSLGMNLKVDMRPGGLAGNGTLKSLKFKFNPYSSRYAVSGYLSYKLDNGLPAENMGNQFRLSSMFNTHGSHQFVNTSAFPLIAPSFHMGTVRLDPPAGGLLRMMVERYLNRR